MRSRKRVENQLNFLAPTFKEQLNPNHELYLLSDMIDWNYFEEEFKQYYSDQGRPAHPIRLMISLLILKSLYNLSDERLVEEHWEMNVYFQYFSGFLEQQWGQPCAASDLVHFRKRIGEEGVEKIFKHSIDKHGDDSDDRHVSIDTTVQEKNITFPTDSKLHKKIIDRCVKKAKEEGISLRRSYKRTIPKLMKLVYNSTHPKRRKKAHSAMNKIKTIAGRLVRELERKLPVNTYDEELELYKRVLAQEKHSKNKIYSLHEPQTCCIGKGKAHKQYEFGCKASIVLTQNTGIIVGAKTFTSNPYDGHTLEEVLQQVEKLTGRVPKSATVDRGYKGKQQIGNTKINIPKPPLKRDTDYQKRKKRNHHRRRAAIEPIIGHLKSDHRAAKNFLKGQVGDSINFLMAASAFNFRKLMKKLKKTLLYIYLSLFNEKSRLELKQILIFEMTF